MLTSLGQWYCLGLLASRSIALSLKDKIEASFEETPTLNGHVNDSCSLSHERYSHKELHSDPLFISLAYPTCMSCVDSYGMHTH